MADSTSYEVGDIVVYRTFGGGEYRTGHVTAKHEDIKNGYPGFDMVDHLGGTYWGYDDQICTVRRMSPAGRA